VTPASLLVLDLGNSALKGALISDGVLQAPFRLEHDADPGFRAALHALPVRPEAAVLVSVVPQRNRVVTRQVHDVLGIETKTVHAGSRWPFRIGYATPQTLGLDRLAACAGAYTPGRALVVLDAGTALTLDVVTADGAYLGGAIAPGPALLPSAAPPPNACRAG
jgi:type III pantothenate kinase